MYMKIDKVRNSSPTTNNQTVQSTAKLISQKKSYGERSFKFEDNRHGDYIQRNNEDSNTLSPPKIKGAIQRVLRVNWPNSVVVGGSSYVGKDGGESGIYYELPVDSRAKDRHISIHKAGENMNDWFKGPGFSVKVHQTRNKYVIVYFFGGSFLSVDYSMAQEQDQEEAAKEAVKIGEDFYSGISGSTKKTF